MTSPQFIMDIMREQDLRYFTIVDSEYRLQYQQWQPISLEESVSRLKKFIDHCSTNTMFRINLYPTNERLKDGTPKRDGLSYEVMITESLREKDRAVEGMQNQNTPMMGFDQYVDKAYNAGSMGAIDLDRYLTTKDEILRLQLRIQQLEMEKKYIEDKAARDLEALRNEHERKSSKEERIMGIASQFFPMVMGGGQSPMNGFEPEIIEHMTQPSVTPKDKIINSVNKLMTLDPNFVRNIEKLAKLAEEKPMVYKMAVEQLNQF